MPVCEYCGTELDQFDHRGNEGWVCPKDCAFWKMVEKLRNEENTKSDAQKLAESEDFINGLEYPSIVKQTHCWTFREDGTHCPGIVTRTPDTEDSPYGHRCPECDHSLRYHKHYGEGGPGDLAQRYPNKFYNP
jgi:hypothetical protein